MIQTLLKEAHQGLALKDEFVQVAGAGATAAAADMERSPETYLGYARQENFASPEAVRRDMPSRYSTPHALRPDQWALNGNWLISGESTLLKAQGGSISYHFRGRDLHLVLGPHGDKPVHFKVTLDGKFPGTDHGVDTDAQGNVVIREQRLYQLVRQSGKIKDRNFRIQFLDEDAEAFAFTFG